MLLTRSLNQRVVDSKTVAIRSFRNYSVIFFLFVFFFLHFLPDQQVHWKQSICSQIGHHSCVSEGGYFRGGEITRNNMFLWNVVEKKVQYYALKCNEVQLKVS